MTTGKFATEQAKNNIAIENEAHRQYIIECADELPEKDIVELSELCHIKMKQYEEYCGRH